MYVAKGAKVASYSNLAEHRFVSAKEGKDMPSETH